MTDQQLPPDWRETVDTFRRLGLSGVDIGRAMRIAQERQAADLWAYTCGILWGWARSRNPVSTLAVGGRL